MTQIKNPETEEAIPEKEESSVPEKVEPLASTENLKDEKISFFHKFSTSESEGKTYFLILKIIKKLIGYSFLTLAEEIIFFLKILTIASTMSFTKPNFVVEFPFVEISNFLTYPPALWDRGFFYLILLFSEQILKVLKNL